jgi:hypothetical protein
LERANLITNGVHSTVLGGSAPPIRFGEGINTLVYFAVDNAGSAAHAVVVRVDSVPPVISNVASFVLR